jgi:hypothetical protein
MFPGIINSFDRPSVASFRTNLRSVNTKYMISTPSWSEGLPADKRVSKLLDPEGPRTHHIETSSPNVNVGNERGIGVRPRCRPSMHLQQHASNRIAASVSFHCHGERFGMGSRIGFDDCDTIPVAAFRVFLSSDQSFPCFKHPAFQRRAFCQDVVKILENVHTTSSRKRRFVRKRSFAGRSSRSK